MFHSRRARYAWLLTLVLVAELALLCCASIHVTAHVCPDCGRCAICECVRAGLNRGAVAPLLALALIVAVAMPAAAPVGRFLPSLPTPFDKRVRLND